MRRALRRAVLLLALTLLVLVLAALGLWRTEPGRAALEDLLARSNAWGVLAGVLVMSAATPLAALRWRCLLPPEASGRGSAFTLTWIQCVAVLFQYSLPGPVGEFVAAGLVHRVYGVGLADGLMSRVVARLVGLAVAAVIAVATFLLFPLPIPEQAHEVVLLAVLPMGMGAAALGWAALRPRRVQGVVAWLAAPLARRPGRLGRWAGRGHHAADRLLEALAAIGARGPGPLLRASAWTFAGHMVAPTGVTLAAWAMGMPASWLGVVFANAFVIVGSLALFLLPGGQAGWDALYWAVFAGSTGVTATDAAAITVLTRLQQSLLVVLGMIAMLSVARRLVDGLVEGDDDLPSRPGM